MDGGIMGDRVGAIIIRNKKLLLVTGYDRTMYWTPGGKLSEDEKHEAALKRELQEELNIHLTDARHLTDVDYRDFKTGEIARSHYYLVDYEGQPEASSEVERFTWFSGNDLVRESKISEIVKNDLLPKLVTRNLL